MDASQQNLSELLELANHYPSPHNGQPVRFKRTGQETFELYFDTSRGLTAADISFLFSFVTMGVFTTHLELCARALGHGCRIEPRLPDVAKLHGEGLVKFADGRLQLGATSPDEALHRTLLFRQTSRKKYSEGVGTALSDKTIDLAAKHGLELVRMGRRATKQAIWLNQRAVFDDMFDDAVRKELDHWLRYNQSEKEQKMDGLAYDCMEMSGGLMKFIVRHYKLLRAPGIGWALQQYYLRTMSDNSDVYYMLAPFSTEQESFEVGVAIMQIWGLLANGGYYLHPFGTIMSNEAAHRDFLALTGITHEDKAKNFLAFIYRAGKSAAPHHSLRLPIKDHLEMEAR